MPKTSPPLGSLPDPPAQFELLEPGWPAGKAAWGEQVWVGGSGYPGTTAHIALIVCCALLLMDTPCSPGSNEFSRLVAGEYLSFFDFSGLTLDRALRSVGLGRCSAHGGTGCTSGFSCQLHHKLDPSGEAREGALRAAAFQRLSECPLRGGC